MIMIILIGIAAFLVTSLDARLVWNKTDLFTRYPTIKESPPCVKSINQMLVSFLESPYDQMSSLYGARYINDLGSLQGC